MGLLPNMRVWRIINNITGEEVEGDFEAEDLGEDVGAAYEDTFALNSDSPITQYLHGEVDVLSFTARLFDDSVTPQAILTNMKFVLVREKLELLKAWVKKDESKGRPPTVVFSAGNGEVSMTSVITSLAGILYDPLNWGGGIRGVTFTVNLKKFIPADISGAASSPPETRYHRAKTGDYYELLAVREYGSAALGDVIRNRHPEQRVLSEALVVKLPSFAAIQREVLAPRSIACKGLHSSKASPQRTVRQYHQDRLNRSVVSHVIPTGL